MKKRWNNLKLWNYHRQICRSPEPIPFVDPVRNVRQGETEKCCPARSKNAIEEGWINCVQLVTRSIRLMRREMIEKGELWRGRGNFGWENSLDSFRKQRRLVSNQIFNTQRLRSRRKDAYNFQIFNKLRRQIGTTWTLTLFHKQLSSRRTVSSPDI